MIRIFTVLLLIVNSILGHSGAYEDWKRGCTTAEFFYGDTASNYQKFLFQLNKESCEIAIRKTNKN